MTALPANVLIGITIASYCPALIVALAACRQVYLRRDTWYDRLAATCVVRNEQLWHHHATAPAFAAQAVGQDNGAGMPAPFGIEAGTALHRGAISPATPPPLPRAPERLRQNYIARHWRGELPLPLSYWVNSTLLGVIAGAAIFTVAALLAEGFEWRPGIALTLMCAIWLAVWLLVVWQSVGVWRSATNYRAGGRKLWGGAAKAAIVLGVASTLWRFCDAGLPQIAGVVDILTGDSAMGPHHFKVLGSGEMLDFSGGIKFGVAAEMQSLLDAMPAVKTVRLNSHGGRIREAQKVSDIISARGLSTLVDKECLRLAPSSSSAAGTARSWRMRDLASISPPIRGSRKPDCSVRSQSRRSGCRSLASAGLSPNAPTRQNRPQCGFPPAANWSTRMLRRVS